MNRPWRPGAGRAAQARRRRAAGAILVLPTVAAGQQGPVAAWVSAAGWASGLRQPARARLDRHARRGDGARRVAPPRIGGDARRAGAVHRWQRWIPVVAKTAVKDAREWRRARAFRVDPSGPWRGHDVACVWQRHELFHTAGPRLARALGVPSVVFVPGAARVAGAAVGRSASGLERGGSSASGSATPLRGADVVACGSEAVAEQVRRIGVDDRRIVITPTGADLDLFRSRPGSRRRAPPPRARRPVRRRLGRELPPLPRARAGGRGDRGSRRRDAPARRRRPGAGRRRAPGARARRRRSACTGTVPHDDVPEYLAAMDVGLVLATSVGPVPLLAAEARRVPRGRGRGGRAQRRRRCRRSSHDGVDAVLVRPATGTSWRAALRRLRDDPALREQLGPRRAIGGRGALVVGPIGRARRWRRPRRGRRSPIRKPPIPVRPFWSEKAPNSVGLRRSRRRAAGALPCRTIRSRGFMAATQPYRIPTVYESTATGIAAAAPVLRRACGPGAGSCGTWRAPT